MASRNYKTSAGEIPNYGKGVAVTVASNTDLGVTDALYIGTTGNLTVTMADGNDVTFTTLPVGLYALRVQVVKSTSTVGAVVALYA